MNIFKFVSSSEFLKDRIANLPRRGRGEVTKMASYLAISTTLMSQILSGDKILTLEQAEKLISYIEFSTQLEADYFILIIQYERSGTENLKRYWKSKLLELKDKAKTLAERVRTQATLSPEEAAVFYSSNLYSAIRLWTSVTEKDASATSSTVTPGKTLEEIAQRFRLTKKKAAHIVRFLLDTNLIQIIPSSQKGSEQHNRYVMGPQSTFLATTSPLLKNHHSNWRLHALQNFEALDDSELMYTGVISVSKEDFIKIREEMVEVIKRYLKIVHASPAEEVACLNLDFFWVK